MTDKTQEALLPCPFCNGAGRLFKKSGSRGLSCSRWYREYIKCLSCAAETNHHKKPGAAIGAWNTRPQPPAPGNKDALEALEKLEEVAALLPSNSMSERLKVIRTALSHTYDPATHILVARGELEALEHAIDEATHWITIGGLEDAKAHLEKAAALLAQKTEE